jgi:TetR/AcrR family transcriptional regulator
MAARDPEATKRRILDAARHEFSAKGISGARVDTIAARAKVNKRMLYYYFGSKEGLFREILRRGLLERSPNLRTANVANRDRLPERAAMLHSDPEYVRLLMWEALETQPHRPANLELRREFFRAWVAAIEEEQQAGNLPSDLDAAQLVLSEICLTLGPLLVPQLTRLITGRSVQDPEFVRERSDALRALTRRIDQPVVLAE